MNTPKYTLPKTLDDLNKIQDKAIKAATNARNIIQIALVATVHHLAINHDPRVAARLVDGLSETVRGKALVEYLSRFGHLNVGQMDVEVDGKKKTITTFTSIKGKAAEHAASVRGTWDECKATMWWSLKAENPFKGFDMDARLKALLAEAKRASEKVSEGKAAADTVNVKANDATIRSLLALCKFEAIANPANDVPAAKAA